MFFVLLFGLIIVAGLSFQAGARLNYTSVEKDTNDDLEAPLGPSDDKGGGSK